MARFGWIPNFSRHTEFRFSLNLTRRRKVRRQLILLLRAEERLDQAKR